MKCAAMERDASGPSLRLGARTDAPVGEADHPCRVHAGSTPCTYQGQRRWGIIVRGDEPVRCRLRRGWLASFAEQFEQG